MQAAGEIGLLAFLAGRAGAPFWADLSISLNQLVSSLR